MQRDRTEIHLFRHGETEWDRVGRMQGHLNSPLSPDGVKQAIVAREKIAGLHFDHAYSSSSGRALETMNLLLDDRKLKVVPLDNLREIHLGEWEGVSGEDVKKRFPIQHEAFWNHPADYIPGSGESFDALCQRAVTVMDELFSKHPGERLLLVSHAAFLKTYLCHITGLGHNAVWKEPQAVNLAYSVIKKNGARQPAVTLFCDHAWEMN